MTCRYLQRATGGFFCRFLGSGVDPESCGECVFYRTPKPARKTPPISEHPHAVPATPQTADWEAVLRVRRCPPRATHPYK